jgi:hypothetical protein
MKITLSTQDIADRLREDKNANWSHSGASALAEHLEELEKESGDEQEFDVVAVRCEFSEYVTATEAAKEFGWEPENEEGLEGEDEEDREERIVSAALEWLKEQTTVIETDGAAVIIQNF